MKETVNIQETCQKTKQFRNFIFAGLVGTLFALLGDFLLMAFNTADAEGILGSYLSAAVQTTYTRIGLAAFFGFVGIPFSGVGFLALCRITEEQYRESRVYKLCKVSTIAFSVLGGGVHILCCFILTGLKKNIETGTGGTDAVMAVINELGGALLPAILVFMVFYMMMVVTQILLIAKHRTRLPGWVAWINPLTLKILFNLIRNLGSSALVNGISCSNMSLGCIVILLVWFLAERNRD